MARKARDRRQTGPRPVERVEVSDKHVGWRIALFFVALTVAISGLGYGVYAWLSTDAGWVEVEDSTGEVSCSQEFTFRYLITEGGMGATDLLRTLRGAYGELSVRAYRLFTVYEDFDDPEDVGVSHNMKYINEHPNEDIQVDSVLYQAFEQAEQAGSRAVCLGPLYSVYGDLFFCEDDSSAQELDPFQNEEMARFCQELADFAREPEHVSVTLLGENTLRLNVSQQYQEYAEGVGRTCYLDFGWQRTAFIADYIANELSARGFTAGVLSSYDGITRQLGKDTGPQTFSLYDWPGDRALIAAQAEFEEPVNAVSLRTFPLNELDEGRCYVFGNNSLRHSYIDMTDGLCRTGTDSLTLYSREEGCAALILEAEPIFISDGLFPSAFGQLSAQRIYAVLTNGTRILYTEPELTLFNLYDGAEQTYKTELIH